MLKDSPTLLLEFYLRFFAEVYDTKLCQFNDNN